MPGVAAPTLVAAGVSTPLASWPLPAATAVLGAGVVLHAAGVTFELDTPATGVTAAVKGDAAGRGVPAAWLTKGPAVDNVLEGVVMGVVCVLCASVAGAGSDPASSGRCCGAKVNSAVGGVAGVATGALLVTLPEALVGRTFWAALRNLCKRWTMLSTTNR